jgi:N-acetyl-gamma-glutamyl-phosphate reductase
MHPRVAVLGASGYTGVELTKLLAGHPHVELVVASSDRWVGESVSARAGVRLNLRYSALEDAIAQARQCDVVFLATPAEASHDLVPQLVDRARVIDLSGAFRLAEPAKYERYYGFKHGHVGLLKEAVYGLPELFRERIAGARLVANPGCYATAIQLALAPLMQTIASGKAPKSSRDASSTQPFQRLGEELFEGRIIVDAMSGVTGAGRKASEEYSFAEIAGDLRAYRVLRHQHEPEIEQSLSDIAERAVDITFVPHLLPIRRGILATCHTMYTGSHDLGRLYRHAYSGEPFVELAPSAEQVALHDVVGTNQCRIGISLGQDGELVVIAAIDNLVKGAAGQAVQNLNLVCGLDETAGLAGLRSFHP